MRLVLLAGIGRLGLTEKDMEHPEAETDARRPWQEDGFDSCRQAVDGGARMKIRHEREQYR
ncbi:MAG: hypothetical protein SFW09_01215, partial [Hyphomicrobiaceae bacterium]|nr:hypothetical protein [Hyphomicrobiaceae bacterium]